MTFSIDVNGILSVSAKDLATGKEQSIEIKGSSGLNQDEIDKMRRDAESHAEEDRKRRELVDLKNQADHLAYTTEKMLSEQGEKVPAEDRGNIESAVSALREAGKGDNADAIRRAMENLQKSSHKVAEAMYQAAQSAPGGQTPPPQQEPPKGDDDVIDAEYEVKE